ncbi:MAG TPA: DUF2779 domain-containing protein [Pusillimonas sp.]|jgi:hypothetical protein|nr:DUF2779 domain-containing protein [Pusillimonas sp.]|tara:strand:+ start:4571 stop:6040 length:1470 start_codon:yes stop_codon:yes gene_type:complete
MAKKVFWLSKSKIMSGRQCEKRLWLEIHRRELAEVSSATQMTFDHGHMFGDLARSVIGEGALIEHVDNIGLAVSETKKLLGSERLLFEPAFTHQHVLSRADGLLRVRGGWDMIEVKASTSVKDYYLDDCAVQVWVLNGAGVKVRKVTLAFVNNRFVYREKNNYQGLLSYEDITAQVFERVPGIEQWVAKLRKVLDGKEPAINVGTQCSTPYACPFMVYCQSKEPASAEHPVGILPRSGEIVERMAALGIDDLRDVPPAALRNALHHRIRQAHISDRPYLDPEAGQVLRRLGWPRYNLDFETIAFPVPIWKGTRPYQQVPFQWSCHHEMKSGKLFHTGFLDTSGDAPMEDFASSLIKAVGKRGPVFVYNQAFEAARIRELADMLPAMREPLLAIVARLVDLLPITREYYYHPDMRGSFSIKAVLPTVAPDLAYGNLEFVQDGGMAQQAWLEAVSEATSEQRRAELRQGLLDYCERDTLALVRLADFLQGF